MKTAIEVLIIKAQTTQDATDALKFSQAAINVAHAEERVEIIKKMKQTK